MLHTLSLLPYEKSALVPHLSEQTLTFHHEKHHQTYVTNLNNLIPGTVYETMSLEEIIDHAQGKDVGIFNNAAQIWNHDFFWKSMCPSGGGHAKGPLKEAIHQTFGDTFKDIFKQEALKQFGSGWIWLVLDQGNLKITRTGNADLPHLYGQKPLLTCDVWEHAYYLDYQNRRADFVQTFLDHLVNWSFAERNFET